MTLLMHLIEFNQKLRTIGQMAGITEFLPFIFRNLITMFREDQVKLFAHDSLSPATKKHVDLIAKENLVQPNLFNKLGHLSFCFLIRKRKALQRILMREFEKFS